jgi:anti-sigma factor RsiW
MSLRREMDHKEAVETMAAQRYVLDEMTPEDQDAFEEHFFGCAECAADVKDTETIADTLRSENNVVKKFTPRRSPTRWLAAAASLTLVAILGYQNLFTIPRLRRDTEVARSPHIVASYWLRAQNRAADEQATLNGSQPFTLDFEVARSNAQRYVVEVLDAAGHARIRETVAPEKVGADDMLHLFVPAGFLPPGRYSLRARSEPAAAPDSVWSFTVR